jgi:NADPH:quinone reductase
MLGDHRAHVLQRFLDDVAEGRAVVPLAHTYSLDEIVAAHALMETAAQAASWS